MHENGIRSLCGRQSHYLRNALLFAVLRSPPGSHAHTDARAHAHAGTDTDKDTDTDTHQVLECEKAGAALAESLLLLIGRQQLDQ